MLALKTFSAVSSRRGTNRIDLKIRLHSSCTPKLITEKWVPPNGHQTSLEVQNSISKSRVPLVTRLPNIVSWYTCGPTVYDHAHLGHARTYVSIDIMQRILSDYFRLDVVHVMGMTDVDDKIINRAAKESKSITEIAQRFERDFLRDMEELKVRSPTAITRVSEHIPEIIRFIEKIIANGFGYVSNGSVYFDSEAFSVRRKSTRSLLQQSQANLPFDQEPILTRAFLEEEIVAEKRNAADFALWKKLDGVSWSSPWGAGRPGWHIECSAMSSAALGNEIDVHAGGIDLLFPHHENEISQCLAHHLEISQWPSYFLHTGHLHIAGAKMSKSLKNFITIKDFLGKHTASQLRYFCLMNKYNAPVDYTPTRVEEAAALERRFVDFSRALTSALRNASSTREFKWSEAERKLHQKYLETSASVRSALSANFDTPAALEALSELVGATHRYLSQRGDSASTQLLSTILLAVAEVFRTFGVNLTQDESASSFTSEMEVAEAFAKFRSEIRRIALKKEPFEGVLKQCDLARAETFPSLGYKLEDASGYKFALQKSTLLKK